VIETKRTRLLITLYRTNGSHVKLDERETNDRKKKLRARIRNEPCVYSVHTSNHIYISAESEKREANDKLKLNPYRLLCPERKMIRRARTINGTVWWKLRSGIISEYKYSEERGEAGRLWNDGQRKGKHQQREVK